MEPRSKALQKSKVATQAKAETVHNVEKDVEVESKLLLSAPRQAMRFTMVT